MARYTIFMNYDPAIPIGWVDIPDDFHVPEYAIQNGAILPALRKDSSSPTGYKTDSFGLALRRTVDVNKPYVGLDEDENITLLPSPEKKETADERLGKTYRDKVSGFIGVVTQVTEYYKQTEKMLKLTDFTHPEIKESRWVPELSCEPYTNELTLEQKYKAVLVLASWGFGMDHFIKVMDEPDFLTPEWIVRWWGEPIESLVRIDLINMADYKPEWFKE